MHLLEPEAHILVVDDDTQVRQLIGRLLCEHGYRTSGARDGREMREALAATRVDLIVLDLMLPGTSGLDLCRELRASSAVPIIMLTARGEDTDRIVGLELGADDYIPKPFNPRELLARVRAVLRRAAAKPDATQPLGGRRSRSPAMSSTPSVARWRRRTEWGSISAAVNTICCLLSSNIRTEFLSREQLLELSRNRTAEPFDRSINVQVSRLRRKLEAGGATPALIKTVRGAGYLFVPTVKRL